MLKTKQEKEQGFTNKTLKLIKDIEKINLRNKYVFNKGKIEKTVKEIYKVAELECPKIEWCIDITDEKFLDAAGAARVAGAAGAVWAAGAAGAAGAVGVAWAASIDYDFDYFVQEFEFLQHEKGNKNDTKALKLYNLFFKAKKEGLGYFAENDGVLYICPIQ
jgi:hypothetical protein